MVKVFALFLKEQQGTETTLEGIFTTKQRAEKAIDMLNATGIGRQYFTIKEFVLDKIQ